ncbi:uncharacterized protein BKA78DRAFT_138340 [Phyllosticta capitalensis]|uniref:uncharacterized protein n=1 Tax=Phyllosticta capitalensis TaxID=121624 RepID=UPI00312D3880
MLTSESLKKANDQMSVSVPYVPRSKDAGVPFRQLPVFLPGFPASHGPRLLPIREEDTSRPTQSTDACRIAFKMIQRKPKPDQHLQHHAMPPEQKPGYQTPLLMQDGPTQPALQQQRP